MSVDDREEKSRGKLITLVLTVVFILAAGTAVGVFARHERGRFMGALPSTPSDTNASATQSSGPTPSPALLVLNKSANELAIVDPFTKQVVARIPTGNGPHEIAASNDGKFAFATNYGQPPQQAGNTLSVYDLAAQKEIHRVDISPLRAPHGIIFSEGKVYFTAELNKVIARYDLATNAVDWVLGVGQDRTHMVLRTKFLNEFFTANVNSASVTAIVKSSEPSGWSETNIPVGRGCEGIDITPDDKEAWVANADDQTISAISVASSKVTATFKSGAKHANRVKFTLDGKHALVSDPGSDDVVVIDVASRSIVKSLPVGKGPGGILIRPDGKVAYVALAGDNGVAVIDLATFTVMDHFPTGPGPDGMAWAK
ncbi:MAG: YncE family protein [Candidatus Acidiferrales bacterium]